MASSKGERDTLLCLFDSSPSSIVAIYSPSIAEMAAMNGAQDQYGSPGKMSKPRDRISPVLSSSSDASNEQYRWDSATASTLVFKQPQQSNKENIPPQHSSRGREETNSPGKMSFFRSLSPERRGKSRSVSPFKQEKSKRLEAEVIDKSKGPSSSYPSHAEINREFSTMLVSTLNAQGKRYSY